MVGFREPDLPGWLLDEAPLAGEVAARYGNVDHLVVRAPGLFLDGLDRFFDAAEMPYTGTASRVWYEGIMAAAQRRDISVLLTGKCGNYTVSWPGTGLIRSLVGSGRSRQAWREARAQAPTGGLKSTARIFARGGLVARLPAHAQLAITSRHYDDPLLSRQDWWSPLSPINPEFAREQRVAERSRARDCDRWLLRRVDTPAARLRHMMDDVHHISGINGAYSALYGVDIRDPTADARIAQFCLSLPESQCSRQGVSRSLIRRAMADRLPAEIVTGTRHGIDTADWFERLSDARPAVHEELRLLDRSETVRAVLDLPRLRELANSMDSAARRRVPAAARLSQRPRAGADGGPVPALVETRLVRAAVRRARRRARGAAAARPERDRPGRARPAPAARARRQHGLPARRRLPAAARLPARSRAGADGGPVHPLVRGRPLLHLIRRGRRLAWEAPAPKATMEGPHDNRKRSRRRRHVHRGRRGLR